MSNAPWRRVLQANLLAIVSLLIASASLSYNTWHNDVTEQNRNQRAAGFALRQEMQYALSALRCPGKAATNSQTGCRMTDVLKFPRAPGADQPS